MKKDVKRAPLVEVEITPEQERYQAIDNKIVEKSEKLVNDIVEEFGYLKMGDTTHNIIVDLFRKVFTILTERGVIKDKTLYKDEYVRYEDLKHLLSKYKEENRCLKIDRDGAVRRYNELQDKFNDFAHDIRTR